MAQQLTRKEAADLIVSFLNGSCTPYEWDDFTSIPCSDPFVEHARQRCISVRDEYPPAGSIGYSSARGIEILRSIEAELRRRAV